MLEIDWRPDSRRLRWFAVLQWLFCGGLAWVWRDALGSTGLIVLATLSTAIAVVGLIAPQAIRPVYVLWMVIVFPIGWLVGHLLLAIAFYGVLTPIALAVRWKRGDLLQRSFDRDAATCWAERPPQPPIERYFRQF